MIIPAAFRKFFFFAVIVLARTGTAGDYEQHLNDSITRGADTLWALQGADGGWHSTVYGHFKPGVPESALILAVFSRMSVDERAKRAENLRKAEEFLLSQQGKDNALGTKGEWLELPTYANALAVLAFSRLQPENWRKSIEPWVTYLQHAQNCDDNGCAPGDAAYGGWGPEGLPIAGQPRRADLASTRFALQALAAGGLPADQAVFTRARKFLKKVQNLGQAANDGGFYFSRTNFELNKGGEGQGSYRPFLSYGSTTADGMLAYLALSQGAESPELKGAFAWLTNNPNPLECPGLDSGEMLRQSWKDGLNYYYRAALCAALAQWPAGKQAPFDAAWREKLATGTIALQQPSGLWSNPTTIMKEDDPLIATPLALDALLLCREALKK